MKNIAMLIAAGIIIFCIIPIATTQAMQRPTQGNDTFASALPGFNQQELRGLVAELSSPAFKDNILSHGIEAQHGTTIAQSGKSTTTTSTGKTNPHVMRSGRGRSKMGDNATEKDGGDKGNESGDDEEFGDDSAVDYNRGLNNTSGYNEDL